MARRRLAGRQVQRQALTAAHVQGREDVGDDHGTSPYNGVVSSRDGSATWVDEEAPLGSTFVVLVARLLRRGMVSWFLWAPLATGIIAVSGFRAARRVSYDATVVLGAIEGNVRTGADGSHRLRFAATSANGPSPATTSSSW